MIILPACLPLATLTGILGAISLAPGGVESWNLPEELLAGICETAEQVERAALTEAEPVSVAPTSSAGETQGALVAQATTAAAPAATPRPSAQTPAAAPAAAAAPATAAAAAESAAGRVSDEARPIVEKVQSFYENTADFSASFHQTYTYEVGRRVESRGTVAFRKPAMMRWDYQQPRERTFIVDGTDLWIWTPEDFSVVRQRDFTASDLSTSITFLWGEGRLENEFHIELEGEDRLALTPIRPESSFRKVIFKVDPETGRVLESTVVDPQGNRNHMVFSDMRINAGVARERFTFTPPTGADLQDMPGFR